MRAFKMLAVLVAVCLVLPAFAGVVDEAVALAQSGVSEEVQTTWASRQGAVITAQDIVALRAGGVSSGVIIALIRNSGTRVARETPYRATPTAATTYVQPATVTYVDPAPVTYVSYSSPYYYSYPYYGYYPYYSYYPSYRPSFSLGFSFFGGHSGFGGHGSFGGHGGFGHHR
jgi:hypothetical protein